MLLLSGNDVQNSNLLSLIKNSMVADLMMGGIAMSYNYEYLALGILLIVLGFISLQRSKKQRSFCSASVEAKVSEVEQQRTTRFDKTDPECRNIYFPTFSYIANGEVYTHKSEFPLKYNQKPNVGDTAKLWYNPDDPEQIVTELEFSNSSWRSKIVFLIGVSICAVTASFMLKGI